MDESEIIKRLKEKTIFYNIQAQLSTAQAAKNCNPKFCGASNNCSYSFSNYEVRQDYFNGRYDVGSDCSNCSTCTKICYQ